MISVDTEVIRQIVSVCSTANESINEAVDALNRVTSHNDWNCKERDTINEYTSQNKIKIRALQERSRNFLSVLTSVSYDFENAENSIGDMFSSLEGLLGGIIAIPIVKPASEVIQENSTYTDSNMWPSNILSKLQDTINHSLIKQNPLVNYSLSRLFDSISICNFSDINLG